MNPKIFRAYDIRGKYPTEINEEIVREIVSSFILKSKVHSSSFKVVIGHDARLSSPQLYRAAIKGIKNYELRIRNNKLKSKKQKTIIHNSPYNPPAGGYTGQVKFIILPIGLSTTPMLYFLVAHLKADLGIMVTASHNPKEYNGLKIVGKNAFPISGKEINKIIRS